MVAKPEPARQGVLQGLVAAEAVEDYVALQSQIEELETQLEEWRRVIVDLCWAEELNRVFGREHAITDKVVEKAGFGEDEVRALLEPAGLWPRVLSFDPAKFKQLLDDEEISGEIKRGIEALRQFIATSPWLWVRKPIEEE